MIGVPMFIRIRFNTLRFVVNVVVILGQVLLMIFEVPGWIPIQIGFVVLFTLLNFKTLKNNLRSMVRRRA